MRICLTVSTFIFLFFNKAALAASGCNSDGMFSPCSNSELANQWLDWLFYAKPMQNSADLPAAGSLTQIQTALLGAFSFFSHAVLAIAGLILLYHLLAMIAETAHSGKPMGRANQIWAPIRLALAIGLLIPVGSGLNVAQAMTVQIAKWGSGLASQTWNIFLDGMSNTMSASLLPPNAPPPQFAEAIENVVMMNACQKAVNYQIGILYPQDGTSLASVGNNYKIGNAPTFKTNDTTLGNNASAYCGKYSFSSTPNNSKEPIISIYQYYSSEGNFAQSLTSDVITNLADKVLIHLNGNYNGSKAKASDLNNTITVLWSKTQVFLSGLSSSNRMRDATNLLKEQSQKDGWVMAGSWFNTIAKAQGAVMDANINALIKTTPPDYEFIKQRAVASGVEVNDPSDLGQSVYGERAFQRETTKIPVNNLYGSTFDVLIKFKSDLTGRSQGNGGDVSSQASADEIDNSETGWLITGLFKLIDKAGRQAGIFPSDGSLLFKLTSASPFAELARIGHNNLSFGFSCIQWSIFISGASGIASIIPTTGGASLILKALEKCGAILASVLAAISSIFILNGVMLTFVLPMLPFIKFFFAVLVWILIVFEAVVAMPLFALGHLNPKGEGITGMSTSGYFFLLSILLRPVLMVFGLIAGLLLFYIAVFFLNKVFLIAAFDTGAYSGFATLSKIIFSVMYTVLAYICANTCFKAISHFPDHALNWMGSKGVGTQDLHDQGTFGSAMGAAAGYVGAAGLGNAVGALNRHLLGSPKDRPDKKADLPKNNGTKPSVTNGSQTSVSEPEGGTSSNINQMVTSVSKEQGHNETKPHTPTPTNTASGNSANLGSALTPLVSSAASGGTNTSGVMSEAANQTNMVLDKTDPQNNSNTHTPQVPSDFPKKDN